MAQKRFHFGARFGKFVLPNDQFAREPRGLDRSETLENIERHAGHSDQENGGNAIGRIGHSCNRTERAETDKRKSLVNCSRAGDES